MDKVCHFSKPVCEKLPMPTFMLADSTLVLETQKILTLKLSKGRQALHESWAACGKLGFIESSC